MSQKISFLMTNGLRKLNFQKSQAHNFIGGFNKINRFSVKTTATTNVLKHQNDKLDESEVTKFSEVYHKITADMRKSNAGELSEANQWFNKALDYNLPHGKMNRGLSVVHAYLQLNNNQPDERNMEKARILGWGLELLQVYFLVVDDIMDGSITRRGKPCWYRNEEVGMIAINDALMMENTCYDLIKTHFGTEPYYTNLIDLTIDNVKKTIYGQCLDLLSFRNGLETKPDLTKYTMDRYSSIVKYKTSYYSFCLPVRLAMYISGLNDTESHSNAEQILLKIGEYFQIQDDVLDCFGDPKVIGKVGTDIEEGKCCWPVVTALQMADSEQRNILEKYYGLKDGNAVANVKRVYNKLGIENAFGVLSENSYNDICEHIESVVKSSKLPANVFYSVLNKIHKRQK